MKAAEALANFGISSGEDLSHRQLSEAGYLDPAGYFEEAAALLGDIRPAIDTSVVGELEDYADKWNPGGFMVFPLGLHKTLGSLRLHVWPPNVERQSANGPNIHNHAWHLCSLVHRGTYSDTLFDLHEPEQPGVDQPSEGLKLYQTHRNGEGKDTLITDGKIIEPVPRETRKIEEGDIHTIEAGTYHIPTVPLEAHVVTLVLDSPAFAAVTGVVLARKEKEIARLRRPLEVADVALAREVILSTNTDR